MVRAYKRKTNRSEWSENDIKKAIECVRDEKMSIRKAAIQYNVPKSTLERHLNMKVKHPGKPKLGFFSPVFDKTYENQLVKHALDMQKMLFGLTTDTMRSLAFDFAKANNLKVPFNPQNKKAGKDWLLSFLKRNPRLSLRQPEPTSLSRATGFNFVQVSRFFNLLKEIMDEKKILPNNLYNMDETGISCVQKPGKIIASKGTKQVGRVTSAERGKIVTVVCAVNAIGNYVPPLFIFSRKRMHPALLKGAPHGSCGFPSDSGWIDSNIFMKWLKHFVSFAQPSKQNPVLIILDNHSSHLSLGAINFARENFITMLSIPPHSSHKLQPLDKCFFGPLKVYYNQSIDFWMVNNPGKRVTNWEICELFCKAYQKAATVQKGVKGFASTGIYPFNPHIFTDSDFAPALVTEINDPVVSTIQNDQSASNIHNITLYYPTADKNQDQFVSNNTNSDLCTTTNQLQNEQSVSCNLNTSVDITNTNNRPIPELIESTSSENLPIITVSDISPLPNAKLKMRKRKAQQSEILTSSPFKKTVQLKAYSKQPGNAVKCTKVVKAKKNSTKIIPLFIL